MMTRLRICYGGSFDPVHNGHLAVAQAAQSLFDAELCWLPAGDPPHKDHTHASAAQRAEMVRLAIADQPGMQLDCRELLRNRPSYTVETLQALRQALGPACPIAWLIGGDSLLQLARWHRWRELFTLAHIIGVQRPGAEVNTEQLRAKAPEVLAELDGRWCSPAALQQISAGGFALMPMPQLRPESSTELRRRIAAGEDWQAWVPPPVAAYIVRQGLYRGQAGILPPSLSSHRP